MSSATRDSISIGGIYVILAGLWIYLSDAFLGVLIPSAQGLIFWQTIKGLAFISITGMLIGGGVYYQLRKRELVQRALKVTEDHLTALLESAGDFGLFRMAIDAGSDQMPRVLIANPGVATLLAIPTPYAFEDWSTNVLPEDRDAFDKVLSSVSGIGESVQQIFRIRGGEGDDVRWIEAVGMTVQDSASSTIFLNGLLVDITERVQLEQQLAQSQRLEAVGQLAGGIAHDFNNLLTVILGQSQLLANDLKEDSPLSRGLSEVTAAAERAADLTRQLLTFSRRQIVEPRVLQLNDRVKNLETMIRRLIGENIHCSTVLAPDLQLVRIDPPQLDQVILNLCVNARDAMPDGGDLVIRTENAFLDEAFARSRPGVTPGDYVLLSVRDSGVGMDKSVQAHVFEPFFTTKSREKGTGLGLSTVYGIVKKAKGNVWVESAPGEGAEFQVYLPRALEDRSSETRRVSVAAPAGKERVLVVEDDAGVREVICQLLRDLGYRVSIFSEPERVLDLDDEELADIDLLLTDVILPEVTGKELARRLRNRRPDLPVLFASGYADDVLAKHGALEERPAFLQKPFSKERLAQKVREVLNA